VATIAIARVRNRKLVSFLAIVNGLGTIAEVWVARSSSGNRSRLPPGELPLVPVASVSDRNFLLRHLERNGPIAKAPTLRQLERPMVCVRGLRRGASVLREHSADLAPSGMGFDPLIPGRFIRSMEPTDHARYKALFRRAFSQESVSACGPYFRQEARAAVAQLAAEAQRDPDLHLDPRPMIGRATVRSNARLFFGVLADSPELALVETMMLEPGPLYALPGPSAPRHDELRRATDVMAGIVRAKAAELDVLPSVANSFLGALLRTKPDALSDSTVLLNLVFMFATSSRDLTGLLRWAVKMLGDNPVWIGRVRSSTGDLDKRIVMETLRLAQSEFIARKVRRSFELDGYRIPRGWWFHVCVNESHRDPAVFPSPERFDPDRFDQRRFSAAEYAPFGMFEHSCLGVPTTYTLGAAFIREYCQFDWVIREDAKPEYDGFHWVTSRRLRIGLA
jgi:cytochrome P450